MDRQIAENLLRQLGRSTLAMLGAKDFIAIENGLQFKFRGNRKMNRMRIELNARDLYDIKFEKVGMNRKTFEPIYKIIDEQVDVFAGNLHEVIREATGLETRMPVIRRI